MRAFLHSFSDLFSWKIARGSRGFHKSPLYLVSIAAALLLVQCGSRVKIELSTATRGGGFQLFGKNLAQTIRETNPRLQVKAIPSRGSRQNLKWLESGRVMMGLVEGNAARPALEGIGRKKADLRVLFVMYPNPGAFVIRGDKPYRTIADLKGKPIAFGTRASGLRMLARDMLDGLDLKPDRDFKQIILKNAGQGPRLVLKGEVEAFWGAGIGWPGFVKTARGPRGARFIAPSEKEIERILAKHPHLKRMSIPAGTYKGQKKEIRSAGLWSLVLVRGDMPEKTAYMLAKAIDRGHARLVQKLGQGRYTTAKNTAENVGSDLLHPGAARYFKEIGVLK